MARRSHASPAGALVLGLAAIAVLVFVLKTLLITCAILAVPFGIWWVLDREKRKTAAWQARWAWGPPSPRLRVDPVAEAIRADDLGLPESAEYWRGHYEPQHHDDEAKRKHDRDLARNKKMVMSDVHQRAEQARQRFWDRAAREVERRRR